jgi:hypothetical protein
VVRDRVGRAAVRRGGSRDAGPPRREAKRARLALFDWAVTEVDRLLADDDAEKISQGAAIGCCEAARTGVKLDAGVYSGHPDYRKVWDR